MIGRRAALLYKRTPILVFLILALFCISSAASQVELVPGKPQQGALAAGKKQSYVLSLTAGDFVRIEIETREAEFAFNVYDPSGSKIRGFEIGPENAKVNFVTEATGPHRIEIASNENTAEVNYSITLTKIVALKDRLAAAPTGYESPRIKALRATVESAQQGSVEKFWDDVKKEGSPLMEPLQGDEHNMLVTFLWKGRPDTCNVLLLWWPYTGQLPDDYRMLRLAETDIWYKTLKVGRHKRFAYRLAINAPHLPVDLGLLTPELLSLLDAATQPDPLNPKRWAVRGDDPDAPQYQGYSVVEMPEAPVQPWLEKRPGVPQGRVEEHEFTSALLKNKREIGVYLPPGYSRNAKPYGLLFLFDESVYINSARNGTIVPAPTILDNLISENRIPPVIAVFLDNPLNTRYSELTCNPTFADFLNSELVPWVRHSYNVTADARQTVVGGSSFGALAASCAGLRYPGTFGNILSQSGACWWTPPKRNPSDPDTEPDWMAKQFIASPRLPLRFYMDAGTDELDLTGDGGDILVPNRNLRDVLLAKGYEVHYQEFDGGHDGLSWRSTLADGLILLMGGASTQSLQQPAAKPQP
jgi:enterochelin esterase-like enzyme